MSEAEEIAIIRHLFARAARKVGSAARLAETLGISYEDLRSYHYGTAVPADAGLLRAVDLILDELPAIRAMFSQKAWRSLSLPSNGNGR